MIEEDEIDLRPYVIMVLRHWKLIGGLAAIAGMIAGMVTLATPVVYESTATISTTGTSTGLSAVTSGQVNSVPQPAVQPKAYIDLAMGDSVLSQLAQGLASTSGGSPLSAAELKSRLKAAGGPEPRWVVLKAQDTDPDRAVKIASLWTSIFVQVANATLNSPQGALADLESQAQVARNELREAEGELAAQESRNSVQLLEAQVASQRQTLIDLYTMKATLQAAADQADGMSGRFRQLDPGAPSSPADDVAVARLQLKILGANSQVQLPMSLASGRTVGSQLTYVDSLSAAIDNQSAEIQKQISGTQTALLDTQKKLQLAQDEQAPLTASRDNLRQALTNLDLRSNQLRIATAAGINQARSLSDGTEQAMPIPRSTSKNVAIAVAIALGISLAAAFGAEYMKSKRAIRETSPQA